MVATDAPGTDDAFLSSSRMSVNPRLLAATAHDPMPACAMRLVISAMLPIATAAPFS